jgi:hypothetical protein
MLIMAVREKKIKDSQNSHNTKEYDTANQNHNDCPELKIDSYSTFNDEHVEGGWKVG